MNKFVMTITGGNGINSYAGVAFGQVDGMTDADLYYCTGSKLQSAAITSTVPPTDATNADAGLENVSANTTNGVATCSFTRPASVTKTVSGGAQIFNLTQDEHYILLAHGVLTGGSVSYHGGTATNRAISQSRVDLTQFQTGGFSGVDPMVKAHGSLMVVAWLLMSNLGVSIARHFKPLFPGVEPGGVKLWFQLHRFMMVTALLATITGFIIIFVHVGGFSSQIMSHAIIGIVVMALALTNPIMAMFRPHPNTERRPIFNWMHYTVGSIARILAIANLFLGVEAHGSLPNWIAVLGGFVGWVVLCEIVLEILSFHYMHTVLGTARNAKKSDAGMSDMQIEDGKDVVRGQGVKTAVLVIYALGLLSFSIAFFISIA